MSFLVAEGEGLDDRPVAERERVVAPEACHYKTQDTRRAGPDQERERGSSSTSEHHFIGSYSYRLYSLLATGRPGPKKKTRTGPGAALLLLPSAVKNARGASTSTR